MPLDLTDRTLLEQFARLRWGPTGFRCPHCDHLHARRISTRPRTRVCKRCKHQTSVTAGTLLAHTKLPLRCWFDHATYLDAGPQQPFPTTRQAAEDLGISVSATWLLTHKVFRLAQAIQRRVMPNTSLLELFRVPVRRPHRLSVPASAPPTVRALCRWLVEGRGRSEVEVMTQSSGRFSSLYRVAPTSFERRVYDNYNHRYVLPSRPSPSLRDQLRRHRGISLRWLPSWLHALLHFSNQHTYGPHNPIPLAFDLAARLPPHPKRRLEPWVRTQFP